MAFSKIIFNNTTLMDVTDDTVVADKLVTSYTATRADGVEITGTYTGADLSDATATADEIYEGKTAYIATGKATGTADIVHTVSSIPSTKDTSIIKLNNTNAYYAWKADGVPPSGGGGSTTIRIEGKDLNITANIADAIAITPYYFDLNRGYVDSGNWKYENPTNTYCDVYIIEPNAIYWLCLGYTVGSRFRACALQTDPTTSTSDIHGALDAIVNKNNPIRYDYVVFHNSASMNLYLVVAKDNAGVTNLNSYLVKLGVAASFVNY